MRNFTYAWRGVCLTFYSPFDFSQVSQDSETPQKVALNMLKEMSVKILLVAGCVLMSCTFAIANTIDVNVNGTEYDVTSENLSWNADASLLESQPWFGNTLLGENIVNAVGGQLGGQLPGSIWFGSAYGPFYDINGDLSNVLLWINSDGLNFGNQDGLQGFTMTYAVVVPAVSSSVPDGGSTIALLGLALIGVVSLRQKSKKAVI